MLLAREPLFLRRGDDPPVHKTPRDVVVGRKCPESRSQAEDFYSAVQIRSVPARRSAGWRCCSPDARAAAAPRKKPRATVSKGPRSDRARPENPPRSTFRARLSDSARRQRSLLGGVRGHDRAGHLDLGRDPRPPGGLPSTSASSIPRARAGSHGRSATFRAKGTKGRRAQRKALYAGRGARDRCPRDWLDLEASLLEAWVGKPARLELSTRAVGPTIRAPPRPVAWAPVRVVAPYAVAAPMPAAPAVDASAPSGRRPSILLVVIHTLRADYPSPYGGSRWNSPNIAEQLARHGALFETVTPRRLGRCRRWARS